MAGAKEGLPPPQPFGFGLGEALANRGEEGPVNHLVESRQWITQRVPFFQSHGLVQKAALIGSKRLGNGKSYPLQGNIAFKERQSAAL